MYSVHSINMKINKNYTNKSALPFVASLFLACVILFSPVADAKIYNPKPKPGKYINWDRVYKERINKIHEKDAKMAATYARLAAKNPDKLRDLIDTWAANKGITHDQFNVWEVKNLYSIISGGSVVLGSFGPSADYEFIVSDDGTKMYWSDATGGYTSITVPARYTTVSGQYASYNSSTGVVCYSWIGCTIPTTASNGNTNNGCSGLPTAPPLVSPLNGATIFENKTISFQWGAPTGWGTNCPTHVYRLQVDDENTFSEPSALDSGFDGSTTSTTADFTLNKEYFWKVQACNAKGCTPSVTRSFILGCGIAPGVASNPTPSDGAIDVVIAPTLSWDGPSDWGSACGMDNNNTFTVYGQVKNGLCETPGPGYSAIPTCTNLSEASTSCVDPFFNTRSTPYCWYVGTNNGTESNTSAATADQVWEFRTEDPLLFENWVTTLFGDFYADTLAEQYPKSANYASPWNPPYAAYEKEPTSSDEPNVALITSNDTDITNDNGANEYNPGSQSNLSVEFANFEETWPASYRGTPPASAINLPLNGGSCSDIFTGSTKLDPYEVYEADASCMSEAINAVDGNPNGYSLASDGYTVIFVTGSTNLEIDSPFTTSNDDYRVVFVTGPNVSVQIDRNLKLATDPDFNSEPLIEAAFIVTKDLTIEGAANDSSIDLTTDPDGSIMVEGPLIARTVNFNRNRGLTNQYPSEIVKYNPNYIYNLTEQERTSLKNNDSGLFVVDVTWISDE